MRQIKKKRGQRGAIKHGGYALMTGGPVPKERAYVGKYLTAVREGFCQDLGGEAQMSTSEVVMLDRLVTALGIVRLIEEYVKERGVIDKPQGFLNPALSKGYVSYCNQVRLATQMLEAAVKERAKARRDEGPTEMEIYAEFMKDAPAQVEKARDADKGQEGDAQPVPPKDGGEL
jgi:hypothetical protein